MKILCKIDIEENSECKRCCASCKNKCEYECIFSKRHMVCGQKIRCKIEKHKGNKGLKDVRNIIKD